MATQGRKATRRDVARLAGVSDAVVSYTLNGGAPVAATTAARVLAAVEELGYRPNRAALALRSGSARTLVLVVPGGADPVFANPFFSEFASTLEAAAQARGYALYTTSTSFEPETLVSRFHEFAARQVDGVLVLPDAGALPRYELDRVGLPWVELNVANPQDGVASLGVDLRHGAFAVTTHLLEHGYERVGFVGPPEGTEPRYLGWLEACASAGVPAGPFVTTTMTHRSGRAAGAAIAADEQRARAYFVVSDRTAVGVLRGLHEGGLDIPRDVAVAGFDGSWEGMYSWPSLTSFRQPLADMAENAVARLLDATEDAKRHDVFRGALLLRRSCGCADVVEDADDAL